MSPSVSVCVLRGGERRETGVCSGDAGFVMSGRPPIGGNSLTVGCVSLELGI